MEAAFGLFRDIDHRGRWASHRTLDRREGLQVDGTSSRSGWRLCGLSAGVYLSGAMLRDLQALLSLGQRAGSPVMSTSAKRFQAALDEKRFGIPRTPPLEIQAPLWVSWNSSWDDVKLVPWHVKADYPVDCERLHCTLAAKECVRRQVVTDSQRTTNTERGQASEYPSCDSDKCDQGSAIRRCLDRTVDVAWHGAGPNHRFERTRSDANEQYLAGRRLSAVGLLSELPSIDSVVKPDG